MPWELSAGWPEPALGNGYSRKLSQLGRHVCGNRKESGCDGTSGKWELCRAMGGGQHGACTALPEPPDVPSSAYSG